MPVFQIRAAGGALAGAIAASLALLASPAALAHARLEKAMPAAGATVSPPNEIRLKFSEGVEPRFSGATLTGPGGANVPVGSPKLDAHDPRMLIVPIAQTLAPGAYIVHWRAVSVDTHHTNGTFQFTVQP